MALLTTNLILQISRVTWPKGIFSLKTSEACKRYTRGGVRGFCTLKNLLYPSCYYWYRTY